MLESSDEAVFYKLPEKRSEVFFGKEFVNGNYVNALENHLLRCSTMLDAYQEELLRAFNREEKRNIHMLDLMYGEAK